MDRMSDLDADEDLPEHPRLRLLRLMVTGMTGTLILAVIAIITLLVIKVMETPAPRPLALPAGVTLPAGERTAAVTLGPGWVGVVTEDAGGASRFRVFDAESGRPGQVLEITTGDITAGD